MSSMSGVGLSRLLLELDLVTSNSARSCLFISSRSGKDSWGSFGLAETSFLVYSGMSIGTSCHGMGLCSGLSDC